jgi:hypothetical protein
MIIRVQKNMNYFCASNVPFNDARLSWEARGVMGYFLSKPDNWRVNTTDLWKQSPGGVTNQKEYCVSFKNSAISNAGNSLMHPVKSSGDSIVYEIPTINGFSVDGKLGDGNQSMGNQSIY